MLLHLYARFTDFSMLNLVNILRFQSLKMILKSSLNVQVNFTHKMIQVKLIELVSKAHDKCTEISIKVV